MRRVFFVALFCTVAAILAAQTPAAEKEAPATYVYATYSKCDLALQGRADELVANVFAPVYDGAVAAKKLQAWGWLAHNTGGEWRRVSYFVAPGLDSMLDTLEEINNKIEKEHALARREFGTICNAHDDYIWRHVTGSTSGPEVARKRAKAGFSVYFVCDPAREERADAIVKEVLAPLYDAQVKAGTLNSWVWFAHYIGGEYRRLAVVDGASFKSVLAARGAIIEALTEKHADTLKEFDEICGSHQDYMWDIEIARP